MGELADEPLGTALWFAMSNSVKVLFIISMAACKQPFEVKVAQNREPTVSLVNKLFTKIIGRPPHAKEIATYRDKNYSEILATLLSSDAYYREGFYHLHRNRLLIDDSSEVFKAESAEDLRTLKLELNDVAKSDNYWDILTYRDRWVIFDVPLPELCLLDVSKASETEKSECKKYMQAALLPEGVYYQTPPYSNEQENVMRYESVYPNFRETCCEKFWSQYSPRPRFCRGILDDKYQDLFNVNLCTDKKADEIGDVAWTDEQLTSAISLYVSMRSYDFRSDKSSESHNNFFMYKPTAGNFLATVQSSDEWQSFLKVRVSEDLQGIHANPYWLSRHRTTVKNRHLHRARVVFISWLCEDISPDAANVSGNLADGKQMLKFRNYFAAGDPIATGDQACFNCHKKIQPIANYFGKLYMGTNYSEEWPPSYMLDRLLAKQNNFERPGIYYDPQQDKFYDHRHKRFDAFVSKYEPYEHLHYFDHMQQYYDIRKQKYFSPDEANVGHPFESYGMAGLAATLSSLPQVKQCVVESTWNTIFGSEWRLNSDEVAAAISVFEKSGNNYRTLLQHLLTKEKAEVYFSAADGEKRFQELVAKERLTCDAVHQLLGQEDLSVAAPRVFKANCVKCHHDGEGYSEFSGYHLFKEDGSLVADADMENIFDKIFDGSMPEGSYVEDTSLNADQQRKIMECFLEQTLGDYSKPIIEQQEDLDKIHLLKN